jgi:hypothetical protein
MLGAEQDVLHQFEDIYFNSSSLMTLFHWQRQDVRREAVFVLVLKICMKYTLFSLETLLHSMFLHCLRHWGPGVDQSGVWYRSSQPQDHMTEFIRVACVKTCKEECQPLLTSFVVNLYSFTVHLLTIVTKSD